MGNGTDVAIESAGLRCSRAICGIARNRAATIGNIAKIYFSPFYNALIIAAGVLPHF
jgi:hypothetical protein